MTQSDKIRTMTDEELEKWCSKIIDRMMVDDRFFLHMVIQGFGRRCERIAEKHEEAKEKPNLLNENVRIAL